MTVAPLMYRRSHHEHGLHTNNPPELRPVSFCFISTPGKGSPHRTRSGLNILLGLREGYFVICCHRFALSCRVSQRSLSFFGQPMVMTQKSGALRSAR